MDIFQTALPRLAEFCMHPKIATDQDLIEEVLDELLLQRSRGKQPVEIGTEKLSDEVAEYVSVALRGGGSAMPTCPPAGR